MNLKYPKISIVTVSYNQGQYLEEAILSVISQNYPNLEYIIIDGGSTDKSVDVIKKYESYLTYWVSEPDKGQSDAISKGIKKCTGDIFNWLCSDDYLEPGSLFEIAKEFDDESIHLLIGSFRTFYTESSDFKIKKGVQLKDKLYKTIVKSYITQPAVYFRLKHFNEVGLNSNLHYVMDYEVWVKYLIKHGQNHIKFTNKILAHCRMHQNSKTIQERDISQLNQSSKFKIEFNSIFFSLANKIKNENAINAINHLSGKLLTHYEININLKDHEELVNKALNYYIYDNALRHYWANNFKFALSLLKYVDKDLLDEDDKSNYKIFFNRSFREPFVKHLRKFKVFRLLFSNKKIDIIK